MEAPQGLIPSNVPPKEIEPHGKFVDVILSSHGSSDISKLAFDEQQIEQRLSEIPPDSPGKLYYLMEMADYPHNQNDEVTRQVDGGELPSIAYFTGYLTGKLKRKPTPSEIEEERKYLGQHNSFSVAQLEMLDRVFARHQDRMGLLIEKHPPYLTDRMKKAGLKIKELINRMAEEVVDGNLSEATILNMKVQAHLKDNGELRDRAMVKQIEDRLGRDGMGIIVRLGSNHEDIVMRLQDAGIATTPFKLDDGRAMAARVYEDPILRMRSTFFGVLDLQDGVQDHEIHIFYQSLRDEGKWKEFNTRMQKVFDSYTTEADYERLGARIKEIGLLETIMEITRWRETRMDRIKSRLAGFK